jgi:hypothetical protein
MRALILALALAAVAGPALADCYLNGELVPEGTVVGGLTCVNGQWVGG